MTVQFQTACAKWYPFSQEQTPQKIAMGVGSGICLAKFLTFKGASESYPKNHPAIRAHQYLKAGQYGRLGGVFFSTCIAIPIFEESVFRGMCYSANHHNSSAEKIQEMVKSSALFAALHFEPRSFMADPKRYLQQASREMPRVFIAGMVLCALAEQGDLIAPTAAHITVNSWSMAAHLRSLMKK